MTGYKLFCFTVTYQAESRCRDEFGWVEGSGPGNGNYQPGSMKVNVLAPDQGLAKVLALQMLGTDGVREGKVEWNATLDVHAIIEVSR